MTTAIMHRISNASLYYKIVAACRVRVLCVNVSYEVKPNTDKLS